VVTKVEPALVLKDKLVIVAGTHNGVVYAEEDIRKLYQKYLTIEKKPVSTRSIDEVHAFDIHRGDDEDHKDSTGTWVGDAEGVYFDEKNKGIGFRKLNIVESDFANKIQFQKQRGKSSFGISPRLNVLRVGTRATEIIPKNISIVLSPAGGEPLMLSRQDSELKEDYEESNVVMELTLSEQESISSGGNPDMDEKQITDALSKVTEAVTGINTRLDQIEKDKEEALKKAEVAELQRKNEELEADKVKLEEELAKKKDGKEEDDEKMQKGKGKEKEDDEKMQKGKKKEEEDEEGKMQKDKKKYKYYGALSARDSLLKKFNITPDLRLMDAQSINRVAEDVVKAAKNFDGTFTLETAQKGIEELQAILVNLPANEKEEKELMSRVDETLSSITEQVADKLDEKTKGGQGRRKGLVLDGEEERKEETLSEKEGGEKSTTVETLRGDLSGMLCAGLGIKG